MKFQVNLKDPDGFWEGVTDAVEQVLPEPISDNELESLTDSRRADVFKQLSTWVRWNEYIVIEFDTESKTATVIKLKP